MLDDVVIRNGRSKYCRSGPCKPQPHSASLTAHFRERAPFVARRLGGIVIKRLRVSVVAVAPFAAVGCAGCAAAPSAHSPSVVAPRASSSSALSPADTPVLSGTISISGGATIPATAFITHAQVDAGQTLTAPPPAATCTDYAHGFEHVPDAVSGSFVAPVIQTSGYHSIYVTVSMTQGYSGPGIYDTDRTPTLSGTAIEGIGSGASAVYTVFKSRDSGVLTLIVNADGSGSLTINHWDSAEVRQREGTSQVNVSGGGHVDMQGMSTDRQLRASLGDAASVKRRGCEPRL